MADLFSKHQKVSGPVECLGKQFPNEQARRGHYIQLLAEKLKDPEFRKLEGFPNGSDEEILRLSNPPYYTACPNPFIGEFIKANGTSYESTAHVTKEPYASDVSEGKNDPIYNAHSYHTKVPHKAIMRYILHYTQPGEVVFDGFCGTGMTGVASQLCANKSAVESLGYKVLPDGRIAEQRTEGDKTSWVPFSRIGERKALLCDLSTAATFIASNYNTPLDADEFNQDLDRLLKTVEADLGWMYETRHVDGKTKGVINYTIWSDVFSCPECAGEVVFWDAAVDHSAGKLRDNFDCPHCGSELSRKGLNRASVTELDVGTGRPVTCAKQVPVMVNYNVGSKRFEKRLDEFDRKVIDRVNQTEIEQWFPVDRMIEGSESRRNDPFGLTHAYHFYTRRNLIALAKIWSLCSNFSDANHARFVFTSAHQYVNRLCRLHIGNHFNKKGGTVDKPLEGTLYLPSISLEVNSIERFRLRARLDRALANIKGRQFVSTQSSSTIAAPDNSIDYIFIDPPFGANLNYSELSFLWESWLGVKTQNKLEAIENRSQGKSINDYRHLMTRCFKEAFRILKPGRWMTVEFSNTQAAVWNTIQTGLQEAGFVVANVSAIDKQKGSFKAVTTATAVKQDLIISAYKPNGGLEDRFKAIGGTDESVWDFVRTHLQYLPTTKMKKGELEFISERDPRIIFDRMVAWFVRHNVPVPMSTHEFQAGLIQRFVERDGMVFLSDQVTEYDRKRALVNEAPQMELFVADERSAIDWLTDFLKRRPSTYQEVHPEFISQLGAGWKKHEAKPELSSLLEANFIQYDGVGEVPSQIHSYLSTNHKDLRSLDKSSPQLVAKAKDRWYVPDPNKAQDLEKKRDKALLKEFEGYQAATGRKLKEFRLEVLRAGFKAAWAAKNYKAIIAIAQKIPEEALQEDEKLLLWYDQALTRTEAGA
jgi:DNA modification methylase